MYTDVTPAITTADEVLGGVAGVREQYRLLDRGLVVLAVEWAKNHPTHPLPPEHPGFEGMEDQWVFDQLHGKGCSSFDDATVPEFAIAAGLTEYSARKLITESLMLVHLLPRVWSRVLAGGLDVWRARNLAGDCFDLTLEAIEFVDRQMSERSVRITLTSRDRIVGEARKRFMPDEEEEAEELAKGSRGVEICTHEHQAGGLVPVFGQLDLPDALALDTALTVGAQALKDAGSDAPLETRRSWALGDLARAATGRGTLFDDAASAHSGADCTLPVGTWVPAGPAGAEPPTNPAPRPYWNGKGTSPPNVKLFIHLPSSEFFSPSTTSPGTAVPTVYGAPSASDSSGSFGIVEGKGISGEKVCDPRTIREWFTRPTLAGAFSPVIKARPVLDLGEYAGADSYQPPRRVREHVTLSHGGCVFPFCTRPAHVCDIDHTEPWKPDGTGGATCTCNLAPACRTHHRLKTHADNAPVTSGEHSKWSYVHLGNEEYYWTGPRGMEFIRTNTGTYNANLNRNDGAPPHPGAHQPSTPAGSVAAGSVALGDDEQREHTEDLIEKLLTKASLTRGVHSRDFSPMWSMPPQKASDSPPDDYPFLDDDDPGGSIEFFIPYTPKPGTVEWNLINPAKAAS